MDLNRVCRIDDRIKVNNILISTADKSGLDEFVIKLLEINPEVNFYSTGGTFARIIEIIGPGYEKNLKSVSSYTGQPEMQGGLVKTLDYKIYLGLLSETYNESHRADLNRTKSVVFDMVVVNLYPFSETVSSKSVTVEDARTNIDIGGPCMLRASAKNFLRVASVCNPGDYPLIIDELSKNDCSLNFDFRFELAKKTFSHTAEYDAAIIKFLSDKKPANLSKIYNF